MTNNVTCDNCHMPMDLTDEDSRQEWYEATYSCRDCGKTKSHKREYDQNGTIISDVVIEL